jgi:hypothetical protein
VTQVAETFGRFCKCLDRLSKKGTEGSAHIGNSSAMTRGHLAQRTMNPQAAPLEQKLDTHVQEYREGSMGGNGVGGGGCGCN